MIKNIFNKNLIKIILLCFAAPTFFANLKIGQTLIIYKAIGFPSYEIKYYGVVGCFPEAWMYPPGWLITLVITLIILISGFLISKKAFVDQNQNRMMAGAFLFYLPTYNFVHEILRLIKHNPLFFLARKSLLESEPLALFGDMYKFEWVYFIFKNLIHILFILLASGVVLKYWDKTLRIQFFTFGLAAAIIGSVFWFSICGPIVYSY